MKNKIIVLFGITISLLLCACSNKEVVPTPEERSLEEVSIETESTSQEVQSEEEITEVVNEHKTQDYWHRTFMMSGQEFLEFCNEVFPGGVFTPSDSNQWSAAPYYSYNGDYANVSIYVPTSEKEWSDAVETVNNFEEFHYGIREGYEILETYPIGVDYEDIPVCQDYFEMITTSDKSVYGYTLFRGNIIVVATFQDADIHRDVILEYVLECFTDFNCYVNYYEINEICEEQVKELQKNQNDTTLLAEENIDVFEQYVIDNAGSFEETPNETEAVLEEDIVSDTSNETSNENPGQAQGTTSEEYSDTPNVLTEEDKIEIQQYMDWWQNMLRENNQ